MRVPFLDLKSQYESIKNEIDDAIRQVIGSCAFAGGPFVEKFEHEFAHFCGCEHAIGVGSGTEALWLSLMALGVGPGDEVITVPNTFIATAEAISICGATPVFVDIDEKTYNMDVSKVETAITKNTKAIIPVHLFGQMAAMDPIMAIAKKNGLFVVEDACQAHGAEYFNRKAGSIGDAGCFSFYPGKNLGAYGEAGAVVSNNADLATKLRMLRDHGQIRKYEHRIMGWNARMDGLQGAILSVKIRHLPIWNQLRRNAAHRYSELLADADGVVTPFEAEGADHVYHVYAVRIKNRRTIMNHLLQNDIHTGIHYPIPLHLQKAFLSSNKKTSSYPIAEKIAQELLSLPIYPEISEPQILSVVRCLKDGIQLNN
jgi:dTDP-4-amino-4,6-dideoxygalactose transaminase